VKDHEDMRAIDSSERRDSKRKAAYRTDVSSIVIIRERNFFHEENLLSVDAAEIMHELGLARLKVAFCLQS